MELRFWNDPETGLPHIYDHGVTEEQVQQVLSRPGQDLPGRGDSKIRIGQTSAGRHLKVIYVPDVDGWGAFIVTAYEPRPKEKRAFRRWQRRKRK